MDNQELTPEQQAEAVYGYVAQQLQSGQSRHRVVEDLTNKGMASLTAEEVVDDVVTMRKKAYRNAGKRNMVIGALWCVGGIAVTAITYQAATGGGVYVVTWGAIIFGAIQFFRGLGQMWGG